MALKKSKARKMSTHELFTLMTLAANDFWRVDSLNLDSTLTKQILIIHCNNPIDTLQLLMTIHIIFQLEWVFLNNIENKDLIKLAEQNIYENYDDIIKYTMITTGLFKKCTHFVDSIDFSKLFYDNKSILALRFDVSIPDFKNYNEIPNWVKDNLICLTYLSNLIGPDNFSCQNDLDKIFNHQYSNIQICYYNSYSGGYLLNVMSTKQLEETK